MKVQVSPTRMELLRLRKRLTLARRGHKLLKDFLEVLMKEFREALKAFKSLRERVDREFPEVLRQFLLARLASSATALDQTLVQVRAGLNVETSTRRVLSATVPHFTPKGIDEAPAYSFLDAPPELDLFTEAFRRLFPTVLDLAEAEHLVRQLIRHIERTRRRVNALEYVLIPGIEEGVRSIQSKLNEMERSNTSRLMLIKKTLEARG
jgi:V/A-type H+-transporting ATPase subunit D